MRVRVLKILVLLAFAAVSTPGVSVASVTPTGQEFGVRLYDVPISDAHNPRGLRYIIDFLHPNTIIHRRILILNQEMHASSFTIYPDAAQITHGMFIGDAGQTRNELTGWIAIQHRTVMLAPYASTLDLVTIHVPREATRGEHYGVIWVQQTATGLSDRGSEIREISRVGVRIYLAIGKGGAPPTKFVITSITGGRAAHGKPYIVVAVDNTGQRAVDLTGEARLTDGPGATSAGPYQEEQVVTLAPGQLGNVVFPVSNLLPSGVWRAAVTLLSGLSTSASASTIRLGGQDTTARSYLDRLVWPIAGITVVAMIFMLRREWRDRARPLRAGHGAASGGAG
jgi:hypothetical protein